MAESGGPERKEQLRLRKNSMCGSQKSLSRKSSKGDPPLSIKSLGQTTNDPLASIPTQNNAERTISHKPSCQIKSISNDEMNFMTFSGGLSPYASKLAPKTLQNTPCQKSMLKDKTKKFEQVMTRRQNQ